jgi:integrase
MPLPNKIPRNFTPFNEVGKPERPEKPYPDFPLFPHAAGVWAKKIRGKLHYFGPWNDPQGALAKYLAEKDALHAGKKPRPEPGALTVKELANHFLNRKQALVDAGELSIRTWIEYRTVCALLVGEFGKGRLVADLGPDDFAALRGQMAQRWGPARLQVAIQSVRSIAKLALDDGLLDRPLLFGSGFARPSKTALRQHRAAQGPRLFSADEIRRLLDAAGQPLRCMILLGINCGYGNADCGRLPLSALDLDGADGGWATFPRAKTGVPRRCWLWPETVAALREALALRKRPKGAADAGLVFLTGQRNSWHKDAYSGPLVEKFRKLLKRLGINGRHRLGFYTLRHTHRTVADEARDQPACDHIMGHEAPHMASVYRQTISDARLRAVSEYVRHWLYSDKSCS